MSAESGTYICANGGGTFQKTRSDEEAILVSNLMGFAIQNVGRLAEERYEKEADEAMTDLENLLLGEAPIDTKRQS